MSAYCLTQLMREFLTDDSDRSAKAVENRHAERSADGQSVNEVVESIAEGNHPCHRLHAGQPSSSEPSAAHLQRRLHLNQNIISYYNAISWASTLGSYFKYYLRLAPRSNFLYCYRGEMTIPIAWCSWCRSKGRRQSCSCRQLWQMKANTAVCVSTVGCKLHWPVHDALLNFVAKTAF